MAEGILPVSPDNMLTIALRDAAMRKAAAEEAKSRSQQDMMAQLAKAGITAAATAYGGPAGGAAAKMFLPMLEQAFGE